MNYTELTQAVKDYTENDETTFVSQIPTFVRQAEERINRSVLIPDLRRNVTGTTTSSNRFVNTPSDFLAVFSFAVVDSSSKYQFLLPKDVNFLREAYPQTTTTGTPVYYAIFNDESFIVAPTPNANYTVQLHYYYDPPSIVTSATSWLGDNAETVLLYGTLLEAYSFMKGEPDLINLYGKRYEEAVAQLYNLGKGLNRSDSYRNGESRVVAQ
jgi:hypothetical protein|tara:strand:+ start:750 stop:1385 length:636 start_codon:yes stop_codon:yes gene_type:complete